MALHLSWNKEQKYEGPGLEGSSFQKDISAFNVNIAFFVCIFLYHPKYFHILKSLSNFHLKNTEKQN